MKRKKIGWICWYSLFYRRHDSTSPSSVHRIHRNKLLTLSPVAALFTPSTIIKINNFLLQLWVHSVPLSLICERHEPSVHSHCVIKMQLKYTRKTHSDHSENGYLIYFLQLHAHRPRAMHFIVQSIWRLFIFFVSFHLVAKEIYAFACSIQTNVYKLNQCAACMR